MKKNKALRNKLKAVIYLYPENCKSLTKNLKTTQMNIRISMFVD